jgi:signal transduction histidine kinase
METILPSVKEFKEIMHLASGKVMWLVLGIPILLLLAIGFVADRTTSAYATSEQWVSHTHEVETVIESLRANLFKMQDGRKGYLLNADSASLSDYVAAAQQLPEDMKTLRGLTGDNPDQQQRLARLAPLLDQKISLLQQSVALRKNGIKDVARQNAFSIQSEQLTGQMMELLSEMRQEENGLLKQRVVLSTDNYARVRVILGIAVAVIVLILLVNFGRLLVELRHRMRAEAAVRRLSSHILRLQDLERRKVARDIHDGIGQYFAASRMGIEGVLQGESLSEAQRKALEEASVLLEQGMAEARTLSHLLHPPLLDEMGFRAAAEWYVSGFSQRSKVQVKLIAPETLESIPKDLELVLFRVLQEALTNIHRHSGSQQAEVRIMSSASSARVTMEIEDWGKGIAPSLLEDFRRKTGTGVGLAGMRERIDDFQGRMDIQSEGKGTLLRVEMPLPRMAQDIARASGPPHAKASFDLSVEEPGDGNGGLRLSAVFP